MRRATQRQRVEFENLMREHVKDYGPTVVQFARRLMRYGATLGRIAEFECNAPDARYGQDEYNKRMQDRWEREQARLEAKEARIKERVTILCERFNCKPVFQGDPRGNTLKIAVPDGYTNDWGREGICVPTS